MSENRPISNRDLDEVKDLIKSESGKTREDIKGLTAKVDAEAKTNAAQEVQIQTNASNIRTQGNRQFAVILAIIGSVIALVFDFVSNGASQ